MTEEEKKAEAAKKAAEKVEAAKVEAETKQATIIEVAKAHAIEAVKAHVPDKVTGVMSAVPEVMVSFSKYGPLGVGMWLAARVFAARRKEDEVPAKPNG